MKKQIWGFTVIFLSLLFVHCAKRGRPTGGEVDSIPPTFVRASPENYSTNFSADEIRIYFDEYIKLQDAQKQIIISPPMDPKPTITPLGSPAKYVKVKINDTLQENTTYAINFGNSVVDNNESNPLPFFKYVFSTGDYIDSLTVSGTVSDALLKEADPYISIMLYEVNENYNDSIVYKELPRYITSTLDSLRSFELTNLKEGTYQLIAIKDLNSDYKYNPGKEKIAYLDSLVTVPTEETFNLNMFREVASYEPERPKQAAGQKILLGYRGKPVVDSIKVAGFPGQPDLEYAITKVPEKDSLYVWYKPAISQDSLVFALNYEGRIDTLTSRIKEMPVDSLTVTTQPSGNLDFGKKFTIKTNTPLSSFNEEFTTIMDKDSLEVSFFSLTNKKNSTVTLDFEVQENQSYSVKMLPGAITDFFGNTNDTIQKKVSTKQFADYGNITLSLQNVDTYPLIVQLTDEKGVVKYEKILESSSSVRFSNITPATYLIRIIYDLNSNGIWDTGSFPERRKPEEIIYFPQAVEIRPNWDDNETFILD